jgi:rhodanese-related sulfurtransferase
VLEADSPLALIDVREHGEYNASHIPGSNSLPRRQLEFRLQRLVPCTDVRVVLVDDDMRRAQLAAHTVQRMGYANVAVLEGGLNRWASEGLRTEWGMNVPSKAFGERIEAEHEVRTIHALELEQRIESGESLLILDARTPDEYHEFCIPGGRSVPGGELAYRIGPLIEAKHPSTVVVNCAGRTRSIIGARILQRMGVPNVVSLKNGTAGWTLAGLELERGADRLSLPEPDLAARQTAEAFAARLCAEDGVERIDVEAVRQLTMRPEDSVERVDTDAARQLTTGSECVYLVDVRTEAEYLAGHIPGFSWFPGGQAVQRADDLVGVRTARIVFCCDGLVRAAVTASWFRQMGYPRVSIVDGGVSAWRERGLEVAVGAETVVPFGLEEARTRTRSISALGLAYSQPRPTVLCVDTSRLFAQGHIPGARWISRSWLELHVGTIQSEIVVTDVDGRSAALAASSLADLGARDVAYLEGGVRAWRAAGLPLELGLSGVMQPPDDVVPSGLERSAAEAVEYLRWETALGPQHGAT